MENMITKFTLEKKDKLIIRCHSEVKKAFKRYAVDYKNYEEALVELLRKVDAWPSRKPKIY